MCIISDNGKICIMTSSSSTSALGLKHLHTGIRKEWISGLAEMQSKYGQYDLTSFEKNKVIVDSHQLIIDGYFLNFLTLFTKITVEQ